MMKDFEARFTQGKRLVALLPFFIVATMLILPLAAHAQETTKTVRVGWYESSFNITDEYGRRSGYAYEYQRRIAAYTGWEYEYVEGTWPELYQMLIDGEIDLMSDVSLTPERMELMLFPDLPMGSEEYYLFVDINNTEITAEDYSSLNGKTVGAYKGSVQIGMFEEWAESQGIKAEIIELMGSVEESLQMLADGEMDVFLALDSYGDPEHNKPIAMIGYSDYYFAVNKNKPELLGELNRAMHRIQSEVSDYNLQLKEKYTQLINANGFLSTQEITWLDSHGSIRVGYQDNYMAFCAQDPENGELTGALKDYLRLASDCLENASLDFSATAYPTEAAAMEAMEKGEVDCVFPVNFTDYDAEVEGAVISRPLMSSEMYAVVRASEQQSLLQSEHVSVAVNEGNMSDEIFILDNYPGWEIKRYKDLSDCLKAVSDGEADCVIVSIYRYNNISKQCEQLNLATVRTGISLKYSFAETEGETELYSILSRVVTIVPESSVNASLAYYSSVDNTITLGEFVRQNPSLVIAVAVAILAMILIIIFQHRFIVARREADESRHKVEDLHKKIFVDALTHVRNKGGYDEYVQQLQSRLDQGEMLDIAIGVFDCDNLKRINDLHGHDKGNLYLKASSDLICHVFQHSPVFRIGGDEFVVILQGEDYGKRNALMRQFEEKQTAISDSAENEWEKVSVSSGMAVYDPVIDQTIKDLLIRADQLMYDNKKTRKVARL